MKAINSFIKSMLIWGNWLSPFLRHENFVNYIKKQERTNGVAILGNGPSLKNFDPESQQNTDYCVVNFAPLSDLFFAVRPRFYVLIDTAFFEKPQDELVNRLRSVSWDLFLFVPYRERKKAQQRFGLNSHIVIIPVHCVGIHDTYSWKKSAFRLFRKGWAMPSPQNVLIAAIYCMINSGFKQINIYGADHSWISQLFVDEHNRLMIKDSHFYDDKEVSCRPILLEDGTESTLCCELRLQADAFGAYEMLRGYAEYLGGVEIINKTVGSFIDAFQR